MDKQKLMCALDDLKCAEASVRTVFEDAESEREIRAQGCTLNDLINAQKRLNKLLFALESQALAENDTAKLFAQRLKELREERGITPAELAVVLGVVRQAVGKYEQGEMLPNIKIIAKAASFFGVSTDYLLGVSRDKGRGSRPPERDDTR